MLAHKFVSESCNYFNLQETTKLSPIDVMGMSSSRFSDGEQAAPRNVDKDTLDMSKMPY